MIKNYWARAIAFLPAMMCIAITAGAQTVSPAPAPEKPPLFKPFLSLPGDLKRVVTTKENLDWLAVGVGTAAAATAGDDKLTVSWSQRAREPFEPGAIVGLTPFQLGAATFTYVMGRATNRPRMMNLGSDLIRAQLVAETMTIALKQVARRSRPEGSGFSFPSGHTGVSFASATVLQRHFGWKVGVPAYAVAGYVAASRVQMRRHYLSDVAFGAAFGIMAGRTVTIGRSRQFLLTPIAAPSGSGAGVGLTLLK